MKILKPYCTFTRHTQLDSRVSFIKSLKCRRSSSDKLFFRTGGRTDGRTERGNNNMPEPSLEIAGIISERRVDSNLYIKEYIKQARY